MCTKPAYLSRPLTLAQAEKMMDEDGYITGRVAASLEEMLFHEKRDFDYMTPDYLVDLLVEGINAFDPSWKVVGVEEDGDTLIIEVTTFIRDFVLEQDALDAESENGHDD